MAGKPGPKITYKPEFCDTAARIISDGGGLGEIATALGVKRETLHLWRKRHVEFEAAIYPVLALGRPTDYKPEYCDRVVELGKQGKVLPQIACALGVTKSTIYLWAQTHSEFSEAMEKSRLEAESIFIEKGWNGIDADKFNTGPYSLLATNCFGWTNNRSKQEVGGVDGNPAIEVNVSVEFIGKD